MLNVFLLNRSTTVAIFSGIESAISKAISFIDEYNRGMKK
jgi:hypothetical protein